MKRRLRVPKIRKSKYVKAVKFESDYQINWQKYVPELKKYRIKSVDFLGIPGDAPKDFIYDREYRPGHRSRQHPTDKFIAKVGSKYCPLESVTEHIITRIGQCFGLCIADSKLRTIEGQVRFLSRYFLKVGEQLTHGAEIYEYSLGKENYAELSEQKLEANYFTFQMTYEAIKVLFQGDETRIIRGYVEMLTFDAIIGHNDRHPYNWGVIVPLKKTRKPHFAPVFDTARALFWNIPEKRVVQMLTDNRQFETYIDECNPPIGWDGKKGVAFFELIGLIWDEFPFLRENINKFLNADTLNKIEKILDDEFGDLLSHDRRKLIMKCLHQRHIRVKDAVYNGM
ncbi:MAG TPA: hypothetical protein DEA22_11440 [Blastocatellia bacterium]|nr:hypothetical protein [Blastocatellia bacterium]